MSQTTHAGPGALREAFYLLSVAKEIPDAKLLDAIVCRYPQFGAELTEFAIAIAVDALRGDYAADAAEAAADPTHVSPAVSRAISHFQNRLHKAMNATPAAPGPSAHMRVPEGGNPFVGLPRDEFRALASRLNTNGVFLIKLRDREIDASTMTPGFQGHVAEGLRAPLDVVIAHFSARSAASTRQFFKANGKPSTGTQQTFEEAVRSSGLSEAQQKFLLGL